jgi:dihydroorotate dehydrogenase electron transfer subunit
LKQGIFTIERNTKIAPGMFEMTLLGDTSAITAPGQFVQIAVPGFYLRRPISVCDCEECRLTIIYKVVGDGTRAMSEMHSRETLDLLTGLGNGYDLDACTGRVLVIGGGAGVPPMYYLAKQLKKMGREVIAILGFQTKTDVFYEEKFKTLGVDTVVTTVDGSCGVAGFVTNAMTMPHDYVCACGPLPMLKAIYDSSGADGAYSFEERMGCGFGACMGCTVKTKTGYKRICKEGPVLRKEEILW